VAGLARLAVGGILKKQAKPEGMKTTPGVAVQPASPIAAAPLTQPLERRLAQAPAATPLPATPVPQVAAPTPVPAPADPIRQLLGGQERYRAHASTDKPIYRTGESVYIRAVLVQALDRKPLPTNAYGVVEILSPKGDPIYQAPAMIQDGALGMNWPIGAEVAGGDYKVKVSFPGQGVTRRRGLPCRRARHRRGPRRRTGGLARDDEAQRLRIHDG